MRPLSCTSVYSASSYAFHVFVHTFVAPQEGVDVLVATPGRVATLLEAEALSLVDCRAIVLDEVQ